MNATQALIDAAEHIEQARRRNPMNGDGYNSAIDRALKVLDKVAGVDSPSRAAAAIRTSIDAAYLARNYPQATA